MPKRKRLFLIDGPGQIYRAIFTKGPRLQAKDGEPTRGTYYFCRMLLKLCRTHSPDMLAVAMDSPRSTLVRRKLYPPYKANRRAEPDPDIPVQKKRIEQLLRLLGLPVIYSKGWEADDVIASLANIFEGDPSIQVVIVSRDKDLVQCMAQENVILYDPMKEVWTNQDAAIEHWGVHPANMIDYQSLVGDSTDNIPGVKGVGPKKAVALLTYYSLPALLDGEPTFEDPPDWAMRMLADPKAVKSLQISRELATLKTDLDFDLTEDDLRFDGLDLKAAAPLFHKLGFRRWK